MHPAMMAMTVGCRGQLLFRVDLCFPFLFPLLLLLFFFLGLFLCLACEMDGRLLSREKEAIFMIV